MAKELDTDTYISLSTQRLFIITALRGLTRLADIDYVLVQPVGEARKFVVAAELLTSLSEKFGWVDVFKFWKLTGQDLTTIVT